MTKEETLKGKINYNKFVWVSEPDACKACQALNGTEYTNINDIPQKVHPNCRCFIDIIEENNENEIKNSEEINELIGDCASLEEEIYKTLNKYNIIKKEDLNKKILTNLKLMLIN